MRVTDALHRHAAARPHAVAAADGRAEWTWAQLAERVADAVRVLAAAGVAPGDRVALIAPDGVAALVAALAVLDVGAVHAPIDHNLALPETAQALATLAVGWVVELAADAPPGTVEPRRTGAARTSDPLGEGRSAFVRCSSGTTGAAKGVLLAHDTILARVAAANRGLGLGPDDRVLWLLPMAYHFAVSILLYLQQGCAVVFANSLRASTTAAIARERAATFLYGSPWHVRRLAELPAGHDLPASLRGAVSTTTALDAGAAAAFHARHGVGVRQALGIIEVGLPLLSPGAAGEQPGWFGRPLPDYRVEIRRADGGVCAADEPGELAIAGPGLLDAYLSPWRSRLELLDRGCFRTGDIASVDGGGNVRLLGRCKDVINVGGVKVFPLEVEAVLDAHPWVAASRVTAGADARTGEQVVAEVQLHPDADRGVVLCELAAWCGDRLAAMKRPARIEVVERLAMTASGKVRR